MKQRLLNIIIKNPIYLRFLFVLKKIKLGKAEVSLYDAIKVFLQKMSSDEILERANAVAFSFTMAIFPAIIFLFTLLPYLQRFFPELTPDAIIEFLEGVMPDNLYEAADETIHDIIKRPRGGLLSLGFLLTLFLSTNGMTSLMNAFNACYKTLETRSFLKMRLIATILIFILSLSLIIAIALLIVGQHFLETTQVKSFIEEHIPIDLLFITRFIVLFAVFFIAISFIYYLAPAVHERWRFFSIGSIFSSLACILASFGFSFYVNNFGTYNKLYGSIGVLLVLMFWLFILSAILLVGFEMNAAIDKAKLEKLKGKY